jgi:hypothetical protein
LLIFNLESEFDMTKKSHGITAQKVSSVSLKCADKRYVDSLILQYNTEAKFAVEKTIAMCKAVFDLHNGEKSGALNKHDVDYFCKSVKLRKNGSQYRKCICIGQSAEMFQDYLDQIPQAISVLYEITTLDSEKFVELIDKKLIDQSTSLQKLKILSGKPVAAKKQVAVKDVLKIEFDIKNLSIDSAKSLIEFYTKIKFNTDIKVTTTDIVTLQKFFDENSSNNEIIDVECNEVCDAVI